MKALFNRQLITFLIAGGFAAGINFGSRVIYNLQFDFSTSIILAYLTGMVTAFVLFRLFVFTDRQQPVKHSALFFILVNIVAAAQTWIVSIVMATYVLPWLGIEQLTHEIAHAVGIVVPVFSSYLGHKRWSFR